MTVEERARQIIDELFWGVGANPSKETIEKYIVEGLRDQIEDCAKIVDEFLTSGDRQAAQLMGERIRALAAPKEEAPDGPDDRFDLGGFECNEKQED